MRFHLDDLSGPEVRALLAEHLQSLRAISPPESVHALDLAGLRKPGVRCWTVWAGEELLGCGALLELAADHGEIKSMRTAAAHRRKGVARAMLAHLVEVARARGYSRISLETGSQAAFDPARALYTSFGFVSCGPFAGYVEDPSSCYMTLRIDERR